MKIDHFDLFKKQIFNSTHPGGAIRNELKKSQMSQRDLALRTGVTEAYISSIINGKKLISPAYAKKLEHVLGYQAIKWLTIQAEHELSMHNLQSLEQIPRKETNVVKKLDEIVTFLKDRQVIEEGSVEQALIEDLRSLLKVADLTLIPEVLKAKSYPQPPSKKTDPYILYTWLTLCEGLAAADEEDRPFDPAALEAEAGKLDQLTNTPVNITALRQTLSACGIRLRLLPRFQKLQARGFVRRNQKGTYVLILPEKAKSNKQFKDNFYNFLEQIKTEKAKEGLVEYETE